MFHKILVPLDVNDKKSTKAVIPVALNCVHAFSSELYLIHVIPDYGLKMVEDYLPSSWFKQQKSKSIEMMKQAVEPLLPADVQPHYAVALGAVYDEVIAESKRINADLIIVPATRSELKSYMLGSNSSKIARFSECSVMVVRD